MRQALQSTQKCSPANLFLMVLADVSLTAWSDDLRPLTTSAVVWRATIEQMPSWQTKSVTFPSLLSCSAHHICRCYCCSLQDSFMHWY